MTPRSVMVLIVRSFLYRNPWMSTSYVRSVTRRRCRSGSFHVCMHPVGRYYREANVYFLKGVRRYPLGNWIFRENPEIIRGHSNFFPGSKKSRQPNLWRPSSLPLCAESPFESEKKKKHRKKKWSAVFEMNRGTNRTKLTPMFLDHEVTFLYTCMELRLKGT